jgi:hypothetical protein
MNIARKLDVADQSSIGGMDSLAAKSRLQAVCARKKPMVMPASCRCRISYIQLAWGVSC